MIMHSTHSYTPPASLPPGSSHPAAEIGRLRQAVDRTEPTFRQLTGHRVQSGTPIRVCCAEVESTLPNPEYQNELEPFREAIAAAGKVRCRRNQATTPRGTQEWLEVYVVDDDEVTLDVTRCNHVPTCIYGEQTFDEDGGQRVGCWLAMLESLDTVRIEQPGGPRMRLLARYFVAIDDCTERSRGKAG